MLQKRVMKNIFISLLISILLSFLLFIAGCNDKGFETEIKRGHFYGRGSQIDRFSNRVTLSFFYKIYLGKNI